MSRWPNWPDRFWAKVDKGDGTGCWLWTGAKSDQGYGHVWVPAQSEEYAHRVAYELLVGPIPQGLELDHVAANGCTNRACVNPAHLEPVTARENTHRSDTVTARHARQSHCTHGHPFDEANTYTRLDRPGRMCRECKRRRDAVYRRLKREGARS